MDAILPAALVFISLPVPADAPNPALWRHDIEHGLEVVLTSLAADVDGGGTYFGDGDGARTAEIFVYPAERESGESVFAVTVGYLVDAAMVPAGTTVSLKIGDERDVLREWTKA